MQNEYLIRKNVNKQDILGNSTLIHSVINGDEFIVQKMLDCGGNVNLLNKNNNGPLYFSLKYKKYNISRIIM